MTRARSIIGAALSASALALTAAGPAAAATLTVDDDRAQCASAGYTSIAAAVDNATTDDTINVCDGTYVEGTGAVGTNALTIDKSLTIKGAGASKVFIQPTVAGTGRIANNPVGGTVPLRNGVGSVIGIGLAAGGTIRTNVNITGVTVRSPGVVSEAGIAYYNSSGSVANTRVTGMTGTGVGANPGTGWGITHVTNQQLEAQPAADIPSRVPRTLTVSSSRIDGYNQGGVLVDGATDAAPTTRSNTINALTMTGSEVVGAGDTTSAAFGQIGLQSSYGARAVVSGSSIRDNQNSTDPTLAYGVKLVDSDNSLVAGSTTSTQTRFSGNAIQNNSRGLFNFNADGTTENTAARVLAETNWWGVATGPVVNPATQPLPGNPVSGPANNDAATGSDSVDFRAFRTTAPAIATTPPAAADAAPTVSVSAAPTTVAPGQTVRIVAKAADDQGVAKVDFLRNGTSVATLTAPPYAVDYTPGTAEAGTTQTFTALVTDSSGQTASATVVITVTQPSSGTGAGTPAGAGTSVPATGTVTPSSTAGPAQVGVKLPATISSKGSLLSVAPSAPAGVREVSFAIGKRVVCRVTAAPYRCRLLPIGSDVGTRTVSVTVIDTLGRRSVTTRRVRFARFAPAAPLLTVRPTSDATDPRRFTFSGRLRRPARVTVAQTCRGTVRITLRAGKRVVATRRVKLGKGCRYKGALSVSAAKLAGAGKLTATATFGGNSVVAGRTSAKKTVTTP